MRIAYLLQMADVSRENGISKKILGQLRAWRAAGHECRWFQLNPFRRVWSPLAEMPHDAPDRGGPLRRTLNSLALCGTIEAWRPDVIYFRYAYHAPGLPSLFKRVPTVAEINSDDTTEYALTLGPARQIYHRLTRGRILRSVAGLAPVTRELGRRLAKFGHPALALANGINLDDFAPLPAPDPSTASRMVFLGSPGTPWHGIDRIGELAALLPHLSVDIIGCERAEWTSAEPPPTNLTFHGHLTRDRYEPMLRESCVALGTFGLHRKRMDEACPLKVREYLALGLPVIAAYEDTDIPADANYYLRLPNNTAPLAPHRDKLHAFVDRWRSARVPRASVAHLDNFAKEPFRLAFMQQIIARWRSARGRPAITP